MELTDDQIKQAIAAGKITAITLDTSIFEAMRIPRHFDHWFHGKTITDSTPFRSSVPRQSDQ